MDNDKIVLSRDNISIDGTVILSVEGALKEYTVDIVDGSPYVHVGGMSLNLDLLDREKS